MAIKGKKKSQKRGSQARRRPAAPPRPTVQPKRRAAWYRTPVGLVALLVVLTAAIGLVVWAVQNAREEAAALEKRQERLDTYTGEVRAILQGLRSPVEAMAAAPPTLEGDKSAEIAAQLEKDGAAWQKDLQAVGTDLAAAVPPEDEALQRAHSLYSQALQLYIGSARGFVLASKLTGESQIEALGLAAGQRDQASQIWSEATAIVDDARRDADLEASGLTAPGTPAPGAQPTLPETIPTELPEGIPTEIPTGGGGAGGQGGGEGGGGSGDGGN